MQRRRLLDLEKWKKAFVGGSCLMGGLNLRLLRYLERSYLERWLLKYCPLTHTDFVTDTVTLWALKDPHALYLSPRVCG